MEFLAEGPLPGVRRLRLRKVADARGAFVKTFAASAYAEAGVNFDLREEYYSTSHKGVVRGMHFQVPPHDHAKIVYCAVGAVEDVLLDLHNGPNYGHHASIELDAEAPELLIIPPGIAHGFRSLRDHSVIVYKTSTEYAPQYDRGIRWDSFGFDWRIGDPIVSDRDRGHPEFSAFKSPF